MTLKRHPSLGARVRDKQRNVVGTVDKTSAEGYSVQWDGGFRVFGYNEKHWDRFELVQPDYRAAGEAVGQLVADKQAAYGDSFGKSHAVIRTLYPDGIRPDQYHQVLTLVRIIDKMFRIANHPDAFGESPYQDIAGYALLGMHSGGNDK